MNTAFRSPSRTVLYWSIFGLGLGLSIVMALRSQVEADQVYPMVRGLGYTLRMASLSLPSRLTSFDFTPAFGATADVWLAPPATLLAGVAHLSALVPIWALVTVLLVTAITAAAPMFRQGGRKAAVAVLTAEEPLIEELGLRNHCTVTIDENHDWAIPD